MGRKPKSLAGGAVAGAGAGRGSGASSDGGAAGHADPSAQPAFSAAGAVLDGTGRLDQSFYKTFAAQVAAGEGAEALRMSLAGETPGLREGEDAPRGLKVWDDTRRGDPSKVGAGWIAEHPVRRTGKLPEAKWFNIRTWGSWRMSFMLARLQRQVWEASISPPAPVDPDAAVASEAAVFPAADSGGVEANAAIESQSSQSASERLTSALTVQQGDEPCPKRRRSAGESVTSTSDAPAAALGEQSDATASASDAPAAASSSAAPASASDAPAAALTSSGDSDMPSKAALSREGESQLPQSASELLTSALIVQQTDGPCPKRRRPAAESVDSSCDAPAVALGEQGACSTSNADDDVPSSSALDLALARAHELRAVVGAGSGEESDLLCPRIQALEAALTQLTDEAQRRTSSAIQSLARLEDTVGLDEGDTAEAIAVADELIQVLSTWKKEGANVDRSESTSHRADVPNFRKDDELPLAALVAGRKKRSRPRLPSLDVEASHALSTLDSQEASDSSRIVAPAASAAQPLGLAADIASAPSVSHSVGSEPTGPANKNGRPTTSRLEQEGRAQGEGQLGRPRAVSDRVPTSLRRFVDDHGAIRQESMDAFVQFMAVQHDVEHRTEMLAVVRRTAVDLGLLQKFVDLGGVGRMATWLETALARPDGHDDLLVEACRLFRVLSKLTMPKLSKLRIVSVATQVRDRFRAAGLSAQDLVGRKDGTEASDGQAQRGKDGRADAATSRLARAFRRAEENITVSFVALPFRKVKTEKFIPLFQAQLLEAGLPAQTGSQLRLQLSEGQGGHATVKICASAWAVHAVAEQLARKHLTVSGAQATVDSCSLPPVQHAMQPMKAVQRAKAADGDPSRRSGRNHKERRAVEPTERTSVSSIPLANLLSAPAPRSAAEKAAERSARLQAKDAAKRAAERIRAPPAPEDSNTWGLKFKHRQTSHEDLQTSHEESRDEAVSEPARSFTDPSDDEEELATAAREKAAMEIEAMRLFRENDAQGVSDSGRSSVMAFTTWSQSTREEIASASMAEREVAGSAAPVVTSQRAAEQAEAEAEMAGNDSFFHHANKVRVKSEGAQHARAEPYRPRKSLTRVKTEDFTEPAESAEVSFVAEVIDEAVRRAVQDEDISSPKNLPCAKTEAKMEPKIEIGRARGAQAGMAEAVGSAHLADGEIEFDVTSGMLVQLTPTSPALAPIEKLLTSWDSTLTIGKDPSNEIVVENELVSRRHCKLQFEAETGYVFLIDTSTNGSFVNENLVENQSLKLSHCDQLLLIHPKLCTPEDPNLGYTLWLHQAPEDLVRAAAAAACAAETERPEAAEAEPAGSEARDAAQKPPLPMPRFIRPMQRPAVVYPFGQRQQSTQVQKPKLTYPYGRRPKQNLVKSDPEEAYATSSFSSDGTELMASFAEPVPPTPWDEQSSGDYGFADTFGVQSVSPVLKKPKLVYPYGQRFHSAPEWKPVIKLAVKKEEASAAAGSSGEQGQSMASATSNTFGAQAVDAAWLESQLPPPVGAPQFGGQPCVDQLDVNFLKMQLTRSLLRQSVVDLGVAHAASPSQDFQRMQSAVAESVALAWQQQPLPPSAPSEASAVPPWRVKQELATPADEMPVSDAVVEDVATASASASNNTSAVDSLEQPGATWSASSASASASESNQVVSQLERLQAVVMPVTLEDIADATTGLVEAPEASEARVDVVQPASGRDSDTEDSDTDGCSDLVKTASSEALLRSREVQERSLEDVLDDLASWTNVILGEDLEMIDEGGAPPDVPPLDVRQAQTPGAMHLAANPSASSDPSALGCEADPYGGSSSEALPTGEPAEALA